MDSKELKMSASESDKMEVSALGHRFSKKAEHLPIKKRRFLFRTPSPPLDTSFSEEPERDAAFYNSSSQVVQPQLDASYPPAASSTVADIDSKMDGEKFVEASKKASEDKDIFGISLVALAACSNGLVGGADPCEVSGIVSHGTERLEAPKTVKLEPICVKPADMSTEETDLHIATTPSKDVASSTLDCSTPDKASEVSGIVSHGTERLEAPKTVKLEPICVKPADMSTEETDLHLATTPSKDVASSTLDCTTPDEPTLENSCFAPSESECSRINQVTSKTDKSAEWDERLNWDLNTVMDAWEEPIEREHRSVSEKISSEILPVGLKSLTHTIEGSEQEECKPGCNDIGKLLPPVICGTSMAVSTTIKVEYPECDISAKHVNVNCKNTDDLSCSMAGVTDFSLDYSLPPGFGHFKNMPASEENIVSSTVVGSGDNVNHAITTVQTTECEKLNLSLVTAASPENGVFQSRNTFDIYDKAEVKKEITSNGITMENLTDKGTKSSQDACITGVCKEVNQTTFGSDAEVAIKAEKSPLTATSGMTQLTETIYHTSHESDTDFPNDHVSYNNKVVCEVPLDNGFGYENFPSDIQAGSEVDNVDEFSVGYDSQFEDGELRESSIQTWEGYEGEDRENEHDIDDRGTSFHLATLGAQCLPESSSRIRSPEVGSQRGADEISSVLLPEKLDSSDQVSGSGPNETKNGTTEVSMKDARESDQWKMNISGLDFLPENHSPTSNAANKMRDFSSIKFSSRIGRYGPETEDLETKAEGSRFYRREPISRIGEPSTRDGFLNRGRFKMQGGSSINADDPASRSIRDPGVMRSLRRGKYSPQVSASGRGGGPWNYSPPYPFRRSLLEDVTPVDNLTNEVNVDPNDNGRPVSSSYITRQSFRTRLLANREEDDFRARLGLRPSGDTCHNRFGNMGRGRSIRYGSRHNGGGPRGQYYAPPSDEYDEPSMEYSHSFPSRRRENNLPCPHHHSGSTSPPRSRTRSPRSPNLRSDTRIRRPRSPNYRDHVGGYNLEPRNDTSPPNSRWVKYKQRSSGERLNFYDPSRKTKQNETHRSGNPGRFLGRGGTRYLGSDGDGTDHGYNRRGGFVRRYDMGRPVKHFQYDEEDGYGPAVYDSRDKEALELHGRGGNPKQPYGNGTETRLPRRPREERENW